MTNSTIRSEKQSAPRRVVRCLTAVAIALASIGTLHAAPRQTYALVNVNVVPMDRERVLRKQTLIVTDGVITALGDAKSTAVPRDAQRIEASDNGYVLPGLADMHVHFDEESDLALYVASGVTTVLHMGGAKSQFVIELPRNIDAGTVVGPRTYCAFMLDGSSEFGMHLIATPDQARDAVRFAKANGYPFIKLYNHISQQVFTATVDEARKQGLAVIGHGVRAVGLPAGLFQGQVMVAHAEEFLYTAFGNETNVAMIPQVVNAVRRSGAFVTPNLSGFEGMSIQWGKPAIVESYLRSEAAAYLSPTIRLEWAESNYMHRQGSIEPQLAFLRTFTKALADADVPLLTGTDGPFIPGMYPGDSEREDLRNLVAAGLSNFQALSAATRIPGEFIRKTVAAAPRFGTVAVGMRADLMVVAANPLDSLATLRQPQGVMADGRWYSPDALHDLLEQRRAIYDKLLAPR
jgi:imidazolonepropionase-like amidohydrolase